MSRPKMSSVHQLTISLRAAQSIARPSLGVRTDGEPLFVDIDTSSTIKGQTQVRALPRPASEAPATIELYQAVDLITGGVGTSAVDERVARAAENDRLQSLIDACVAAANADPAQHRFSRNLPLAPLELLIERIEAVPPLQLTEVGILLAEARSIMRARMQREAGVTKGFEMLLKEAIDGRLSLWGRGKRSANALVERVPLDFLLQRIAFDSSLQNLGLVPSSANAATLRAIIEPSGARSWAFFDVRLIRDEFFRVFPDLVDRPRRRTPDDAPIEVIEHWYIQEHVSDRERRGEIPNRDESLAEAKQRFGDVKRLWQIMRDCRRNLAPPSWRTRRGRKMSGSSEPQ